MARSSRNAAVKTLRFTNVKLHTCLLAVVLVCVMAWSVEVFNVALLSPVGHLWRQSAPGILLGKSVAVADRFLQVVPASPTTDPGQPDVLCRSSAQALLPALKSQRPTRTSRALFGGESEVGKLRRENAELKKQLGEQADGSKGEGFLEKIGNGIKSLLGGGKAEKKEAAPLASPMDLPGGLGLLGTLLKPVIGILGSLLKGSQDDIQTVLSEAQTVLLQSGRLGSSVECGPVFSQSYSSMNINGQQSAQVQLQFQAKGDAGTGMVTCSAAIGPQGVDFRDFRLDGTPLDTSRSAGGAGAGSGIIDVDR